MKEAIDIMHLKTFGKTTEWNQFLTKCLNLNDLKTLADTLYGLQKGMDDAVKKKINDEKMSVFFIRLQRSIEMTMKKIIRKKFPLPNDNPLYTGNDISKFIEIKRKRDHEFEKYLRKVSY